ncbi:peroxisome proliferator-activated receptor gamma coactivator-related protein 1 isoform X1 [Rousettus aegyptiacus]|uniref:Peroxisome proliferator-activated receptor gamma coactivator-related protein 1 n=1 Tax=Rousettus aegyptiacus TaxID=9407 RepID=A0A7J8GDU9_ROUAE|nr:peroxisome proliferator-activated receptor gamma coactivator-related protein 1 isoform X1 [Rousettus aegyptiacus]KAF6458274.1 PPARG related coactivator 1 [Rousettus aegyptiacus]
MAARRGRRDRLAPPPSGGPGPDPGGGVRGSSRGSRSQVPYGTVGTVSGGEQVLLHEEVDDSGFVSLSRLGPCLKDKDLEMEALMLQDETLLGTMQSYMDASLISLIEDFGSLGESRLSLEDQNEVSLLTALTEILDNADSENLSPFDSIPDSELLVSPREGSSLHKLLTLSRTPSERDLITPVDPLGPTTGSSRVSGVEMSLADPPWDFSPPSFLETSSPKLPSWRPTRSRPRRSQSLSPQQRSDGEEEEEVASFSSHILIGERDNSMSSIPDFPMHLACPEEEDKTAAAVAEMAVQAAGDESISSLSELVRAMHPYCLPNLTHLTSLENELQEQPDDLTLPDDCVVLEIVGQAATAGNDLEIPVVVRQIPPGPQPVLLDDSLEANPALQLLLPTVEPEPKEALCPEKEELALDPEEKLESACFLDPTEVVEPTVPKGPQNVPVSAVLSSQRARKGRRKKSKEQPVACTEGYARRLRSSSRGQPAVATEVTSQAGILPQEELQREVGPLHGRGKPRAWARAWTAIVEKPSSGNAESSARQASLTKEGPLDLYPNLGETIKTDLVPGHLSLVDSARANPMLLDSAEADPTAVDPVGGEHVPADCALVDLSSANSELVDPLSADPVLIEPVLADSATIDCTVVVPISGDLPPVDPASANPAPVAPVPDDLAPVNPVLVKSRPTDPRRGAISSAQGSPAPQLLLKSESLDPPKGIIPKVREVMGPLKVESGTSAAIQEARPRPLSLSEYRRRRQQRQGEAEERSSQPPAGKWPSLPETPTGLADIPCLVIPPAPVKKTALQRSPEAPEAGFVPVGPSPASPSPDPPASKPVTSTLTEQVPSQEMPLPARPPAPTVQSVPPTIPTALPFPPGGLGMTPILPLPATGQGVPSVPPAPLQPPSLPMSVGPVPPDPYTHYAPMPPWPCYPPVSPSGYPCPPPPPAVPLVSATAGAYAVPPTCNVPWVPPPAPVPPYSSNCTYGPLGWGPGLQHPPFWPAVPPPPLLPASVGRAVPPPKVERSGIPAGPPESVLPVPMAPPLSLGSADERVSQIEPAKIEIKPVPASPQLKHKLSSPVQSPQNKSSPCLYAESVALEEPTSERLNLETQETRSKEKPSSVVAKGVPTHIPRQSTVTKLPAVHPARLRKLSFLPTPPTQGPEDVVQAFISEIGIEASDLSSLLEQFEKSEAKKECPPPAPADNLAVGNSGSVDPPQEKRPLDRLQAPELANVAGLTPPATPPHQLWKPLAAVSLLAKAKSPKSTAQEGTLKPEGVTEAKHPAAARLQEGVHGPSPVHVGSGDHDYCVRSRTPPKKTPVLVFPEAGSRWNVKRHQDITIKPVLSLGPAAPLPPRIATCKEPLDHRTSNEQADPPAPCLAPSALLSPEASPCRNDMNTRTPPEPSAKRRSMRCYRKACRSASPQSRGWQGRRGRSSSVSSGSNLTSEASSSSSSSSSRSRSRSLSPPHKRWRRSSCSSSGHSRRCSSSSSSSSSSSCSRSRSRSPSPRRRSDRRRRYSSYRSHDHYQRQRVLQKERAIEERRVVFIGKIPGRMTRSELKQRFSVFGEIEECTIHFRVQGDNYGFVTYRYAEEAFAAIESGHKLRQADEQPFDLCFGGRRQFCKRSYSDLDSNREDFDPAPVKSKFDSLDFDTLLKQAQKNLRR